MCTTSNVTYVCNFSGLKISKCTQTSTTTGALSCEYATSFTGTDYPNGIWLHNGYAYISIYQKTVRKCDVGADGLFTNCGASGAASSGINPVQILYYQPKDYLYFVQLPYGSSAGQVTKCSIGASGMLTW